MKIINTSGTHGHLVLTTDRDSRGTSCARELGCPIPIRGWGRPSCCSYNKPRTAGCPAGPTLPRPHTCINSTIIQPNAPKLGPPWRRVYTGLATVGNLARERAGQSSTFGKYMVRRPQKCLTDLWTLVDKLRTGRHK